MMAGEEINHEAAALDEFRNTRRLTGTSSRCFLPRRILLAPLLIIAAV
jgi:hypothetical protein